MNSFNFLSVFGYINLGTAIVSAVGNIQHTLADPSPVTGAILAAEVQPSVDALMSIFPKIKIPADLVLEICNASALAINKRYGK